MVVGSFVCLTTYKTLLGAAGVRGRAFTLSYVVLGTLIVAALVKVLRKVNEKAAPASAGKGQAKGKRLASSGTNGHHAKRT